MPTECPKCGKKFTKEESPRKLASGRHDDPA
jgi:hypothetical protein